MKLFKILIWFFILSFGFQLAFSGGGPRCIYTVTDNGGVLKLDFTADPSSGSFDLGEPKNYDYEHPEDACKDVLIRKGYKIGTKCMATFNSIIIYENNDLYKYLKNKYPSFDEKNLVDFDSSCSDDLSSSTSTNSIQDSTNDDSNSNPSSSTVGNVDENTDVTFDDTVDNVEKRNVCSDSGGVFGFFLDKNSCEAISSEDSKCIYNPYLGGLISSKFVESNLNHLKYDNFEYGCIPNIDFKSCYDYKTESLCKRDVNNLGCTWIDSSKYINFSFGFEKGFCIPNKKFFDKNEHKFYNIDKLYDRWNYILNPSFEDGLKNWTLSSSSIKDIEMNTFDGVKAINIPDNQYISTNITELKKMVTYQPSLYLMANSYDQNSKIELELNLYNSSNQLQNNIKYDLLLSDIYSNSNGGYFKKINFNTLEITDNTTWINIKIKALNVNLYLDAISFEPISSDSISISQQIFKPIESISENASNCNLCFNKGGFNFCTENKSNYLGDCSYMVKDLTKNYKSDLEEYLGKSSNIFYLNKNLDGIDNDLSWQSQSIANSRLFCEMYLNKEQCEDPNNYVNRKYSKLHSKSGANLCKWDDTHGCFKDSDNNNYPDTIELIPLIRAYPDKTKNYFNSFGNYVYSKDDKNEYTDFDLACDTIPPSANIYFIVQNSSGSLIYVNKDYNKLVGNAYINLFASDPISRSCEGYNFDKKLYIDIKVNNNYTYRILNFNQLSESEPVKDYFVDSNNNLLLNDGINNISIIVKDQSGNLGAEKNFTLNLDLSGPKINLTNVNTKSNDNTNFIIGEYLNNNSVLKFNISDFSNYVESCNYSLNPSESETIDPSYYTPKGDFDLSLIPNRGNFEYDFKLPIYNSSSNGDNYELSLSCYDPYNQVTTNHYYFTVDFSSDIVLLKPMIFSNKISNTGVFNDSFNISLISSDEGLKSCKIKFNSEDESELDLEDINPSYNYNLFPDVDFVKNITGKISFISDGFKEGNVTCTDENGNNATQYLYYLYDTKNPKIINYSLIDISNSNSKNIYKLNNKYYTISENVGFKVFVNATGSYLDENKINLSLVDPENKINNINPIYFGFDLTDSINDLDNFEIKNINSFFNLGFYGIDLGNELYLLNYSLKVHDSAGNSVKDNVKYYYDKSIPKFEFNGDMKLNGNNLYTSNIDPLINISFNTPKYRNFTCNVLINDGTYDYQKDFDPTNNLIFSIGDLISGTIDLSNYHNYAITIDCVDIYEKELKNTFNIKFDNTKPVLNKIYFKGGNNRFYKNRLNLVYEDLKDDLIFDFKDTNEEFYNCNYSFYSNQYYDCNETIRHVHFSGDSQKEIDNLLIVGSNSNNNVNDNSIPICMRTNKFYNDQESSFKNEEDLETSILVKAQCFDSVNLHSNITNLTLNLTYVSTNGLIDFQFDFKDGFGYPIVKSISQVAKIEISTNPTGDDSLKTLTDHSKSGGIYTYSVGNNDGIPISSLNTNGGIIYAVAFDEDGNIIDSKPLTLNYDQIPPSVKLTLPDLDVDNKIYSNEFRVDLYSKDSNSNLKEIILKNENLVLFKSNSTDVYYNSTYISLGSTNPDDYKLNSKEFSESVYFKNAIYNHQYEFTLISKDLNDNSNSTSIVFNTSNGIKLTLLNSSNSIVDKSGFNWITKNAKPIISFKLSKHVDSCSVYPFVSDEWKKITNDNSIGLKSITHNNINNNEFEFDLSSDDINQFDLSKLENNSNKIKIICVNGTKNYQFTRELKYINFLPDYVLTSSNGFVLNDEPYNTDITIKSVGPFRDINCNYSLNGGNYISLESNLNNIFEKTIDFSQFQNGIVNLNLKCVDLLGNVGPIKTYKFVVNKDQNLIISNLTISLSNGFKLKNKSDGYYIKEGDKINIDFNLNKHSNVQCSYNLLDQNTNLITDVINFIKNLFNLDSEIINPNENPYSYSIKGLDMNSEVNELTIKCIKGDNSIEKSMIIKKDNLESSINSTLIGE